MTKYPENPLPGEEGYWLLSPEGRREMRRRKLWIMYEEREAANPKRSEFDYYNLGFSQAEYDLITSILFGGRTPANLTHEELDGLLPED